MPDQNDRPIGDTTISGSDVKREDEFAERATVRKPCIHSVGLCEERETMEGMNEQHTQVGRSLCIGSELAMRSTRWLSMVQAMDKGYAQLLYHLKRTPL
jgi:hypothetical protein